MTVSWGVFPLDPGNQEVINWLKNAGLGDDIALVGRNPTLAEMTTVLTDLGLPHSTSDIDEDSLCEVVAGEFGSDQHAHLLGKVDEETVYDFHFWGSGCQERTMLRILRALAQTCGPFVIFESIAATPLVVTADTEIDQALAEWRSRIQRAYSSPG